MIELREFTENDWYGYAGATSWPSRPVALEPYIADGVPVADTWVAILKDRGVEVRGALTATVIVDRNGIAIECMDEDGEDHGSLFSFDPHGLTRAALRAVASALPTPLDPAVLTGAFGFRGE